MGRYLLTTLYLAFVLSLSAAVAQDLGKETRATIAVTRYIEHWSRDLPPKWRRRALPHIPSVSRWSVFYDIDPLLTSVIISCESSWRANINGAAGELGLMQLLHKDAVSCMADPADPDEQIRCGVWWLRHEIERCGNVRRGVNAYATGSCVKPWSRLKYRLGLYRKARERFGGGGDS